MPSEAWPPWYIVTPFTTGQVRGMATWTAQSTYLKMSVPQELRSGCKPRVGASWCLLDTATPLGVSRILLYSIILSPLCTLQSP